jgi:hypothetical protein
VKCMLGVTRKTSRVDVNRKVRAQGLWRCKRTGTVTSGGVHVNVWIP